MQTASEREVDVCAPLAFRPAVSSSNETVYVQYKDIVEINGVNFGTHNEFVEVSFVNSVTRQYVSVADSMQAI